jgi:ribosomal protein L7/L12
MALSTNDALDGAVRWLMSIRELARTDVGVANLLLDTQPDGFSFASLANVSDSSTKSQTPIPVVPTERAPSDLTEEEMSLLRIGKKIPAIKAIRFRTRLGLKECKAIADVWEAVERAAGRLAPGKSWVPASVAPSSEFPCTPPPLPDMDFTDIDAAFVVKPAQKHEDETPCQRSPFDMNDSPTPYIPGN